MTYAQSLFQRANIVPLAESDLRNLPRERMSALIESLKAGTYNATGIRCALLVPYFVVTFWPRTPRTVAVVADDADAAVDEALTMIQRALTGEGGSWEVREVDEAEVPNVRL